MKAIIDQVGDVREAQRDALQPCDERFRLNDLQDAEIGRDRAGHRLLAAPSHGRSGRRIIFGDMLGDFLLEEDQRIFVRRGNRNAQAGPGRRQPDPEGAMRHKPFSVVAVLENHVVIIPQMGLEGCQHALRIGGLDQCLRVCGFHHFA
ncbi:hypothetical protein [Oceaniradius stylonematis]|uniref:hypothetical protein n=1 Tax=Oceaniradius stylonematis TaxID=2184161 RepID=UPI00273E394F|nr:hypothetical protein [Oceaniradius stylonematis]